MSRSIIDPDRHAAWLPELTHPAFDSGRVKKIDPGLTGLQVAVVNKLQSRKQGAVTTGVMAERPAPEVLLRELGRWPLMPLWQEDVGLVELRPYHDLTAFCAVTKTEMNLLLRGLRVDRNRIKRRMVLSALFSLRRLAVWGNSLNHYFFEFAVSKGDWVAEPFYLLIL